RRTSNPAVIQEKLDNLKKRPVAAWPQDEPKSEKLQEIEKEFAKLAEQPGDPGDKEKVREALQALRPLEEKLKERIDDLKAGQEKDKNLRQQLKDLPPPNADDPKADRNDGPGKQLNDALGKGDLDRAREELDRLADKLAKDQLNGDDR